MISKESIKDVQRIRLEDDKDLQTLLELYRNSIENQNRLVSKINQKIDDTHWKLDKKTGYLK